MKIILLLLLITTLFSCSKNLDEFKLWSMADEVEAKIDVILPKSMEDDPVKCSDYPEGCLRGREVKLRSVEMIVVEFKDEEFAKKAAFILNQYYYKNWLFDDVTGEPVLEDFVKKAFNAVRPSLPAKKQSEPTQF